MVGNPYLIALCQSCPLCGQDRCQARRSLPTSGLLARVVRTFPVLTSNLRVSKISKCLNRCGLCFFYNSCRCSFSDLIPRNFVLAFSFRVLPLSSRTRLLSTKSACFGGPQENARNLPRGPLAVGWLSRAWNGGRWRWPVSACWSPFPVPCDALLDHTFKPPNSLLQR